MNIVITVPQNACPQPDASWRHRPIKFPDLDERRLMRADERDLAKAASEAWELLNDSNVDPWLFRYAGKLTYLTEDDQGLPIPVTATEDRLLLLLAHLGDWVVEKKFGFASEYPPRRVASALLSTANPDVPVLTAIVNTPVFGKTGQLMTTYGYHPDARLFYAPSRGFELPTVSKCPSQEDIAEARRLLCDELLGDFPFVGPAARANAIGLLLLHFVRDMIDGPTPLHVIEKPTPGTGASLMVEAIATLVTGAPATFMTEAGSDTEWRKRITATLLEMPAMVVIDNLSKVLDSPTLAATLTSSVSKDRILGFSEMARLPNRCIWIATGNNPAFSSEMARRLVRIRLDANVERPAERQGFQHPRLIAWVRENRARLVWACLTLCQAWIAAGRPRGGAILGSFEDYSEVMGGLLEVAGIEGFLGNRDEVNAVLSDNDMAWDAFIEAWWEQFGDRPVGTAALFPLSLTCEPGFSLEGQNDRAQRTSFGKALCRMRDRVFRLDDRSVQLKSAGRAQNAALWRLAAVDGVDSEASSAPG